MCQSIFLGWSLMGCLCFLHRQHTFWIQPGFLLAVLSYLLCLVQALLQPCLHGSTVLPFISRLYFTLKTRIKLKSRLGYELPHSDSPHFQLITKDCSSVSHFCHCGQISLPAVHFHSIHLLFLHYSTAIRYGTSFPKIPNFNLVKRLADWTISAVPSISKLTECLHSSSGLLGAHGSVRHPRVWQASAQAHQHTYTNALSGEKQGANYGRLWQGTAVGKSVSPQAGHSAPDTLPACPLTVIGVLWYLSMGNKGTMETLKLLWRICWRCFLSRHYNQIILNCAALCSLAHSLSLLK